MPAPKSLLLVDDCQSYRTLLTREFRRAEPGMAVWTMSDGARAIEHLALCGSSHGMHDLVLLDREMPGGPNGCEVLRAARALDHLRSLPILMVSGSDDPDHVSEAQAAGASGYITKPPEQDAFPRLVQQVLAWWQVRLDENLLRDFCAAVTLPGSNPGPAALLSAAAMNAPSILPTSVSPSVPPESPLAMIGRMLGDFVGYVTAGNVAHTSGLYTDRKLMEITIACREVGIEERHALHKSQDPIIVEKRGRVIRRLMAMEWSNTELLERFEVRKRTIVELRRQYRAETQKSCAVVALGRR